MTKSKKQIDNQEALDALHRDVYDKSMAPYWAVAVSYTHLRAHETLR